MYGYSDPTIRTTSEGEQVGPRMHKCVSRVGSDSLFYRSMNELAVSVGPNGSSDYGYRVVKRCLGKGLIELDDDHPDAAPNSRGAVVLTDKGRRYLDEHE